MIQLPASKLRELLEKAWNQGCSCQANHQGYSWMVLIEKRRDLPRPTDQWLQIKMDVDKLIQKVSLDAWFDELTVRAKQNLQSHIETSFIKAGKKFSQFISKQ